jgi:hypothetical protein
VESIETAAAEERKRTGRPVAGVKAILDRHPQYRPAKLSRSPAPLVHAATKAVWDEFYAMYSWFVAASRMRPASCAWAIARLASRRAASRRRSPSPRGSLRSLDL